MERNVKSLRAEMEQHSYARKPPALYPKETEFLWKHKFTGACVCLKRNLVIVHILFQVHYKTVKFVFFPNLHWSRFFIN